MSSPKRDGTKGSPMRLRYHMYVGGSSLESPAVNALSIGQDTFRLPCRARLRGRYKTGEKSPTFQGQMPDWRAGPTSRARGPHPSAGDWIFSQRH